jgi:hypothetical protein
MLNRKYSRPRKSASDFVSYGVKLRNSLQPQSLSYANNKIIIISSTFNFLPKFQLVNLLLLMESRHKSWWEGTGRHSSLKSFIGYPVLRLYTVFCKSFFEGGLKQIFYRKKWQLQSRMPCQWQVRGIGRVLRWQAPYSDWSVSPPHGPTPIGMAFVRAS